MGYSVEFHKTTSGTVDFSVQSCTDFDCNNFSVIGFRMSETELRTMHAKIAGFLEDMK
jgi:hypothetical protein